MDIKIVSHIAQLSYLEMPREELEQFTGELASILEHISQLNRVEVTGVLPTAQAVPTANIFRDDASRTQSNETLAEDLVNAAPENEDGHVKVKAIL